MKGDVLIVEWWDVYIIIPQGEDIGTIVWVITREKPR